MAVKGDRKPNCGICGTPKIERGDRLICPECARRYAREAHRRKGRKPLTQAEKQNRYNNRKRVRPSGLTNQKVYAMKQRYNVSEDEFLMMWNGQKGKCGICQTKLIPVEALIDHCHDTGAVRGLLCRACNFGLGLFKDDEKTLQQAIDYIRSR